MPRWFLVHDESPLSPEENMARDEYLFQRCHHEKSGFLRIYAWKIPSFSFGVSQKIEKALDLDVIRSGGMAFVRRITGGKTVLHDDEITYAVASSEDVFYQDHDLYRSYMLISRVLVAAFRRLSIHATLAQADPRGLARSDQPCFSFPTPNEIEVNGKKIIGSAQKRDKQALLQHGSIPITMDHRRYADGARYEAPALRRSMTTLREVSDAGRSELVRALVDSFEEFLQMPLERTEIDDEKDISPLRRKYASRDWNFRL